MGGHSRGTLGGHSRDSEDSLALGSGRAGRGRARLISKSNDPTARAGNYAPRCGYSADVVPHKLLRGTLRFYVTDLLMASTPANRLRQHPSR